MWERIINKAGFHPRWENAMLHSEIPNSEILKDVARQLMSAFEVVVQDRRFRVSRTSSNRLRTVRFILDGREYQAIEQNPDKPSRWGELARKGHRVVQFRDLQTQKYVAAAVDEKVHPYGPRPGNPEAGQHKNE